MKKVIVACAAVLALGLASCGDTKMCYEVKAYVNGKLIGSTHLYETSNDIDAAINVWEKGLELASLGQTIEIKRSTLPNLTSKSDCKD